MFSGQGVDKINHAGGVGKMVGGVIQFIFFAMEGSLIFQKPYWRGHSIFHPYKNWQFFIPHWISSIWGIHASICVCSRQSMAHHISEMAVWIHLIFCSMITIFSDFKKVENWWFYGFLLLFVVLFELMIYMVRPRFQRWLHGSIWEFTAWWLTSPYWCSFSKIWKK